MQNCISRGCTHCCRAAAGPPWHWLGDGCPTDHGRWCTGTISGALAACKALRPWQPPRQRGAQPGVGAAVQAGPPHPAAGHFKAGGGWVAAVAHAAARLLLPFASCPQYKVRDMTQADFGRLEIEMAEAEMPGLMACRTECVAPPEPPPQPPGPACASQRHLTPAHRRAPLLASLTLPPHRPPPPAGLAPSSPSRAPRSRAPCT